MVNLHGLAEKLKIDDMAVCGAEKFSEVEAILKKDMKLGILPPFTDLDIRKRVCPEETLAGAAGFIVVLEHIRRKPIKSGQVSMEIFLRQPAAKIITGLWAKS